MCCRYRKAWALHLQGRREDAMDVLASARREGLTNDECEELALNLAGAHCTIELMEAGKYFGVVDNVTCKLR
jgi:hypothetical protein